MDWTEQLKCYGPVRLPVGAGTVEILHWAYNAHLPNNRPHRHTFFEVCQVGGYGEGTFIVEGKDHDLASGSICVARPGVIHQIVNTAEPAMELFWLCFQWIPSSNVHGELDRLMQGFADAGDVVTPDADGRLAAQWQALAALSCGIGRPGFEAQINAQTTALLLTVAQTANYDADLLPARRAVDRNSSARLAVRFVHDNLARPLEVSEIASQISMSPRQLLRIFRDFTGVSPTSYIVHARMDRARVLLSQTQMPIKEVSLAVGYADVHHFTRVFTRQVQAPPGEFRRNPVSDHVSNIQKIGDLV